MHVTRPITRMRPPTYLMLWSRRSFAASKILSEKALPPRKVIAEDEITESFLKGTGPGGQKINKTSSAVQLKHLPTGIVVKSQATRSREQNRKYARQILAEKLEHLEKGDQSRSAIKAERARTKKASSSKKRRRKYRLLAEEKEAGASGDEEGGTADDTVPGESVSDSSGSMSGEMMNDADLNALEPERKRAS